MIITFTKMKKEKRLRLSIPDIIPSVNSKMSYQKCDTFLYKSKRKFSTGEITVDVECKATLYYVSIICFNEGRFYLCI